MLREETGYYGAQSNPLLIKSLFYLKAGLLYILLYSIRKYQIFILILIILYPYTYCNEKRLIPSTSVDPNQTSPVGAI